MDMIKAFSKTALVCGCVIAGAGALHAETISQDSGVTVIRGIDDADTAAQRSSARGRSGVTVFRGEGMPAETAVQPSSAAAAAPSVLIGGKNLWVYDAGDSSVTACSLRYDIYGNRVVRCSERY
jgi:hypothetical protein